MPGAAGGADEPCGLPATDPGNGEALRRLAEAGRQWAERRGSDWNEVLGAGRLPPGAAPNGFRWRVVSDALRFAAGRCPVPPADFAALPLGLQSFLAGAVPASLRPPAAPPDLAAAEAARADADRLAAEMTERAPADGPDGQVRAAAAVPPGPAPLPARPAGPEPGDAAELLASALAPQDAAQPLPPGAAAVLARLRAGPLPMGELRELARNFGALPGSLLDALDREAVRTRGVPATRVEGGAVHLCTGPAGAEAQKGFVRDGT